MRRYPTGGRAQLEFDIYQRARDLMHLSCLSMLPEQEVPVSNMHLWQLVRQASTASNGAAIREFACPMRHMRKCKVGLCIVEGPGFMQLERFGMHEKDSHVIPPQPAFSGSFQDNDFSPPPRDSDEADAEEDEEDGDDKDEDGDEDEDDDEDSGDDNTHDTRHILHWDHIRR